MSRRLALVTGGSGFIGTNMIDHLLDEGWEAINFDVTAPRNTVRQALWTSVDILDRELLIAEMRRLKPTVLLHFAARTDLGERANLGGYAANIDGVMNVIEAVRAAGSVERMVIASSQLVCPPGYTPRDEYEVAPSTLYGKSKVLTERIVRLASDAGTTWTIVRPTSVWGPWFSVPFRPLFRLIERNAYVHPSHVTVHKQWGFVGNTVHQLARLLEARDQFVQGRTLYLADYEAVELYDFVERVRRAFGAKPVRRVPAEMLRGAAMLGDVARAIGWKEPPLSTFRYRNLVTDEIADTQPIRDITGPLPYSLDEGIEATVRWMRLQVA